MGMGTPFADEPEVLVNESVFGNSAEESFREAFVLEALGDAGGGLEGAKLSGDGVR